MKRVTILLLLIVFSFSLFVMQTAGSASTDKGKKSLTLDDLNGTRIGVQTGTIFDKIVLKRLPDAKISHFNSTSDMVQALMGRKIDAFPCDEPVLRTIKSENSQITMLPDYLDTFEFAYIFNKNDNGKKLCEQMSSFIRQMKEEGRLNKLYHKWLDGSMNSASMPDDEKLKGEKGTLVFAVESLIPPFVFRRDSKIVGLEIELAILFCQENGYKLKIMDMSFDGILPSVQSGKADFGGSAISITEERAKSVYFSEPHYSAGTVMAVLKEDVGPQPEFTDFSQLRGKKVSMLTGAPFEGLVRSKVPDVGGFSYFNSMPDIIEALKSGKTDAALSNNAVSLLSVNRNPEVTLFPKSLKDSVYGIAFSKGDKNRELWQAAYNSIPEETKEAAWEKWTGADESAKVLPDQDWPGKNGRVKAAVCDTLEPMSYVGDKGQLVGFDIEMILLMAREMDVHVDFTGMEFAAVLSSVQSGKAQIGAGSIIVTDERKEAVDFVEYYPASFVLVVRTTGIDEENQSFLESIKSSFYKTFIRENRWKLFIDGVRTTLVITFFSFVLGTILGFLVFMLCRKGNQLANQITGFLLWLVKGMPMVVFLMILYYIIFGKTSVSGSLVAVTAFTITFGAAVFGLMQMGVGAVDPGQYEAAYALGYGSRKTFFRIILPQALPHILPAYRGELVSLIKATAIVGYIAVQDLTKVGDIVRSRTYEAFFPLIAVTVIYFILEELIGILVTGLERMNDPRKRNREKILKGVKTDDQD